MKYLFLDTNVLLHYQCFEDIPWQNLLKLQEDVTIVITETVVAEVDKHKDGSRSRLRDKAKKMTNETFRDRLGIAAQNYSIASRIIADAIDAKLVKPQSEGQSKKYAQYIPIWA